MKTNRSFRCVSVFVATLLTLSAWVHVQGQEQTFENRRLLDLPGGLGNTMFAGSAAALFPKAGNGKGSNAVSDVTVGDYNGDGHADVLVGSFQSDEIAVFFGRGNGSFAPPVRSGLASAVADASRGRVTAVVNVRPFVNGGSLCAAAVDYADATADQVVYLTIGAQGGIAVAPFSPASFASPQSNPTALAVGSLTPNGRDVAVLCSGSDDGRGGGGFVAVDLGADGKVDQRIGGGIDPQTPTVAEAGESGSVYDARSANAANAYDFNTDKPNRRLFRVTPATEYAAGIAPRGVTFVDSAHRGDGLVDLAFVATDYGSANTAATGIGGTVIPAPKREPEGAVFVLVNKGDGSLLRNARRLTEPYDFGTGAGTSAGKQNGVILGAQAMPSGVAVGDFDGDRRLDLAVSNAGAGSVGIYSATTIKEANTPAPSTSETISYGTGRFAAVAGSPNTVYAQDLNGDGLTDIAGTNGGGNGYALFNRPGADFTPGSLAFLPASTAVGKTRTAAFGGSPFNGLSERVDFGDAGQGARADAVFASAEEAGGVGVRYGKATATTSTTFGTIKLSSFVGIVETRVDEDALPDMAVCDAGAVRVVTKTNTPSGFSGEQSRTAFVDLGDLFPDLEETRNLTSIDTADVEGNNRQDLVVAADSPNGGQVFVLYNIGGFADLDARYTIRAYPIADDPTCVKFADLCGPNGVGKPDGKPEIVALNRRANKVTTLINDGKGIFTKGFTVESGGIEPVAQAMGDFNDDDKIDTAVLNRFISTPTGEGETQSSVVVLLGTGDGSFSKPSAMIPVAPRSVSIAAAGYGIVYNGIQIDVPDRNLDGVTDLIVASQLGGGPSSDVVNPFTNTREAAALARLTGDAKQSGTFNRPFTPEPLIDTLVTSGRIGVFPGAVDVRDGRVIGYGSLTIQGDFNQNGRIDSHVAGVETNNGAVASGTGSVSGNGFAATVNSLDHLDAAFSSQRSFSVFPSTTNEPNSITARFPVDVDSITGAAIAGNYVVSATGQVVSQRDNDFEPSEKVLPDILQATVNGRVYLSKSVGFVFNHAPVLTTSRGEGDFNGPGRKVVVKEGDEVKIVLRASDVDPTPLRDLKFQLVQSPDFAALVENGDGTATVTIKPRPGDGAAGENGGLGRRYDFHAEVTDGDFRLPLSAPIFFGIYVNKGATAPVLTPIPSQTLFSGETLAVPVTATDPNNRPLRLEASFQASFITFSDKGGGKGEFVLRPREGDVGVHTLRVKATNDTGQSAETTFTVTVQPTLRVESAEYAKKRLTIRGFGFGTTPTVKINGAAVSSSRINQATDDTILLKGGKQQLGLRSGANTVQVTGRSGQSSNVFTFNVAGE